MCLIDEIFIMATAAFRQTTTVAHSPSDCLHDVIDEVWVVALAVDVRCFFHVLSTVLYVWCRAPSGHPVVQSVFCRLVARRWRSVLGGIVIVAVATPLMLGCNVDYHLLPRRGADLFI